MTENADVIFVGNKPPMSYVLAIITSLSASNLKGDECVRGQGVGDAIARAPDDIRAPGGRSQFDADFPSILTVTGEIVRTPASAIAWVMRETRLCASPVRRSNSPDGRPGVAGDVLDHGEFTGIDAVVGQVFSVARSATSRTARASRWRSAARMGQSYHL